MQLRFIEQKIITGLSTRTDNATEMSPNGKIPLLWQQFDAQIAVDYQAGERVYGVYFDYASDMHGEFSVLAGFDGPSWPSKLDVKQHTIAEGNYLVFSQTGEMPDIAITAWQQVWSYFSDKDAQYKRLYTTDFEYYPNANQIEVHIAVN